MAITSFWKQGVYLLPIPIIIAKDERMTGDWYFYSALSSQRAVFAGGKLPSAVSIAIACINFY
ncbi:hypothetical protein [Nostoc sp. CALU 1950]|uniref:hypothetical protein n=1 Tax=Nostoc sp. CALU 1950 TaxID=3104321 RepID=UPI003EB97BA0